MATQRYTRVGEVRPSQLMHAYGVGAIVDLPKLSVIVTGLDDWPTDRPYVREIVEERLLAAVRARLPFVYDNETSHDYETSVHDYETSGNQRFGRLRR